MEENDYSVSFGTNCRDANHELMMISLLEVYNYIKDGTAGLINETANLRKVIKLDADRYRIMKTRLPFISCSHFEPSYRKNINFKKAIGFFIDIDWKSAFDEKKYAQLLLDPRVAMAYRSPSGMGAKLILLFMNPITEVTIYTHIYKKVVHDFAQQYHILDVVDFKNSDASRISFLSYDESAYYNDFPIYIEVETDQYIDTKLPQSPREKIDKSNEELPREIYREILSKLDTRPKLIKPTEPLIIDKVKELVPAIEQAFAQYEIQLIDTIGIQYGVKLMIKLHKDLGEVNLYYGKKGYSIISTAKKGTNSHLNETAKHILETIIPSY